MPLFTLTVSLDDLGLDVVADEVVEVTKNRLLLVDAYPPVNNLYKIREVTDVSGLAEFELEPDDDSTFHKITIHDTENVLIYERIFIMPSATVAIEDTDPSFSSSTIQIKSNGTNVGTPYSVSALNFIGAVLELANGTVTITITPASIGADVTGAAAAAEAAAKAYADSLVINMWDDRGSYSAAGNTYPSTGGSGTAGAILKGDIWTISTAGTLGANTVEIGDTVRALVDSPSTTDANWAIGQNNIGWVAENQANKATNLLTPDNTKYPTTLAVSTAIDLAKIQSIVVAASDETTALAAGTAKVTFRMPYAFTLTEVRASLTTAQTSGSILTVDINESGSTILSTKLTIDNTEKTSTTAATAAVISDTALADDAEITIDIDQIGDGTAKGLKVTLIGTRT